MELRILCKTPKFLMAIAIGASVYFMSISGVSSGSHVSANLNYLPISENSLPETLFANTNPVKPKKALYRGLASEESEVNKKESKKTKDEKAKESDEAYSMLDPNLYEDGEGAGDFLQINQLNDQLNR